MGSGVPAHQGADNRPRFFRKPSKIKPGTPLFAPLATKIAGSERHIVSRESQYASLPAN
jgi:hypothetical protein